VGIIGSIQAKQNKTTNLSEFIDATTKAGGSKVAYHDAKTGPITLYDLEISERKRRNSLVSPGEESRKIKKRI